MRPGDGDDVHGSEDEERRLFQALPDGAVLYDVLFDEGETPIDYRVCDVNAAYEAITGAARATWVGKLLSEFEPCSDHLERFASVVATGQVARYEVHDRRRDRHFQVCAFPTGAGRVTALVRDVTEQRKAGAALRAAEELFRTTVENLPINLALYDCDDRVLYMNPGLAATCVALNQRPLDQLVGRRGAELWPANVWGPLHAYTQRAIETGQRQNYELEIEQPEKGRSVRLWTIVPLRGPQGTVHRILAISRDVTVERRLVDELREADQRKSEFIGLLSHELRNPLAAIRSSLYVLERAPTGDAAARARAIIDRQVRQLARMVDDLLDVTRINRNKIKLQRRTVDLNDLVQATVDDNRAHFERGGVRIEVRLASAKVLVEVDGARIAQVLTNLLANAVKFTPCGGWARVSVSEEDGSGVLRVADSGTGIDPALLPDLFEPFMQADRTLDRSGGGLGLGLALVKGLVELHGGQVAASSKGQGLGAEFVVRLPLEAAAKATTPPSPPELPVRARRRVLVIEDDPDVADGLRAALEMDGHDVEVACDGHDGIVQAHAIKPEVVLCDIGLPGKDGYEVGRAIRADETLGGTLLVALTGYAQAEDVAKARAAGFDVHLAKPVGIDRILGLLARERN
jgi:two-component system CheB/CheR fusion protein